MNIFKKWLIPLILIGVCLIVFFMVWPTVADLIPLSAYEGVDLFVSREYVSYDNGILFESYMQSVEFSENAEYLDFFFSESSSRDHPFYGKAADFCKLDIRLDAGEFAKLQERVKNDSRFVAIDIGNYNAYKLFEEDGKYFNVFVVLFHKERAQVRYFMKADLTDHNRWSANKPFTQQVDWYD